MDLSVSPRVCTVFELTKYVKRLLETDEVLSHISVRGEISNFKHHQSGHMYFTLKDERSTLKCVMFRSRNQRLNFRPASGNRVIARGSVSIYEPSGAYQLYVDTMRADGVGDLHHRFLQLKEKLSEQGLFEESRKRRLPLLPGRVAIITSAGAAALRDIIIVAQRRWPGCKLIVAPVLVQGEGAPEQICQALYHINRLKLADVIILGRGGGSLEELWAFNDEHLARKIFGSKIPVVSAVGHETDVTISDLVADVRAPTPSAAAEMVIPVRDELLNRIDNLQRRGGSACQQRIERAQQRLDRIVSTQALSCPQDSIERRGQMVDEQLRLLHEAGQQAVKNPTSELRVIIGRLEALSPRSVMARGYSVCQLGDGQVVSEISQVKPDSDIEVIVTDGKMGCKVVRINRHGEVKA